MVDDKSTQGRKRSQRAAEGAESGSRLAATLRRLHRPKRALVTAGMPYANGPLHIGHLAGAHLPADIHARFLGMLIGRENVLFVSGSDDHGSASELLALHRGEPVADVVRALHDYQELTLRRYDISLDVYSGASQPDCVQIQTELCQTFIRRAWQHGLLEKRTSRQWYDPKLQRFLPDRLVVGRCPNPKCDNTSAYSDECEVCGHQYDPTALIEPRSSISDAIPEMRTTAQLWLNMEPVAETLRTWIESRRKEWRQPVVALALSTVLPRVQFTKDFEPAYKLGRASLPEHRQQYARGGNVELQFPNKAALEQALPQLRALGIEAQVVSDWSRRSITRDIAWGIPIPEDLDPELSGKTLYVWPDSLLAPIAFSQVALRRQGRDPASYAEYWRDPESRVYQFLGQDNVFFYVVLQGAMWLSMQADPHRLPLPGELQMTDVFSCFHLLVNGEKMSKSRGNFFTGEQLLDEKGYKADQLRYFLALLGLPEKQSDFDITKLEARNRFLAGPMNSALERPISAAHSKFGGMVPAGVLLDQVVADGERIAERYLRAMEAANYPGILFEIENFARTVNSLFNRYRPHDDRHPLESRSNALYTCFYVLKNLMIMLFPFVPTTMNRLRESLALPATVFRLEELGTPIPAGHQLGQMQAFFPAVEGEAKAGNESPEE
jgi:methionyl-tRNA synthetase